MCLSTDLRDSGYAVFVHDEYAALQTWLGSPEGAPGGYHELARFLDIGDASEFAHDVRQHAADWINTFYSADLIFRSK